MSAKRTRKGKPGGTPRVPAASGECQRGASTIGRGAENFVPVGMIALDDYGILTPQEQIDAIKFLPDEDAPRFYVVKLKSREVIVELSPELAARAAELRHKADAEQYAFTRSLMLAMQHTRSPKDGTALEEDLMWLAGGEGHLKPERILQAASLACRIRETLTERVIDMQRLPIGSRERDKAAKRLNSLFANAIDSLNNADTKRLDKRAIVIKSNTVHGTTHKDVAYEAIVAAQRFIANPKNGFKEPSKKRLAEKIIRRFPDVFQGPRAGASYWAKIWKRAGLTGLREGIQGE